MVMWFSHNHGTEFLDIETIFWTIQDWVLKVSIQAGFGFETVEKCMLDCVVNCFQDIFRA